MLLELFRFGHGLDVVGLSTVGFIVLYALCLGLLNAALPSGSRSSGQKKKKKKKKTTAAALTADLPLTERLRIIIRMVGPIHALLVGLPALEAVLEVLLGHEDGFGEPWPEAEELRAVTAVSAGYMLADGLLNIYLGEGVMVLHHVLTLSAEFAFVYSLYGTTVPSAHFPTAVYLATELTAPFLHCEFLMRKFGVRPKWTLAGVWYTLDLGLIVVAWLLMRVATFFFMFYKLYLSWEAHGMGDIVAGRMGPGPVGQFVHTYLFGALLTLLNVFWLGKIFNMIATKGLGLASSTAKPKKQ